MMLKPLPNSISTFRKIIEGEFLYIDKTQSVYQLVHHGAGAYFLSRPRRFGKSLLISTLVEVFRGNRELFHGLWIDSSDYDWKTHPIIRLDFSQEPTKTAETLSNTISIYLSEIAASYGVDLPEGPYYRQFRNLIQVLAKESQVVILIDEYDKPLIDNLENLEEATRIRDTLKAFYAVIKALEQHIRLTFITGISKFSKVSIFSDLNNLNDLTIDGRFGTMLGITEEELTHYFQDRLPLFAEQEQLTVAELRDKIRYWYDGFRFSHVPAAVYNPFSTMLLFEKFSFHNYWFESGTPTFLVKLIKQKEADLPRLRALKIREIAFSTYEIENLAIIPLLYQTGYLTIKDYEPEQRRYNTFISKSGSGRAFS